MLYLLDANALIDANRDYYPIARVPEFWDWLVHIGTENLAKIPLEIHEEIKDGGDDLGAWVREVHVKDALLLDREVDEALVARVLAEGYAADLTDDEVERVGRDPFLIAYALASPAEIAIVTTEVSKPRQIRANRHIPDVCANFGIRSFNTFEFVRLLNFRTGWRP